MSIRATVDDKMVWNNEIIMEIMVIQALINLGVIGTEITKRISRQR